MSARCSCGDFVLCSPADGVLGFEQHGLAIEWVAGWPLDPVLGAFAADSSVVVVDPHVVVAAEEYPVGHIGCPVVACPIRRRGGLRSRMVVVRSRGWRIRPRWRRARCAVFRRTVVGCVPGRGRGRSRRTGSGGIRRRRLVVATVAMEIAAVWPSMCPAPVRRSRSATVAWMRTPGLRVPNTRP